MFAGLEDCEDGKIIEAHCHKSKAYHVRKVKKGQVIDIMKLKSAPMKPTRDDYRSVLFKPKTTVRLKYQEIAKKDFVLHTREVTKLGLTALNDKLLVKRCRIHCEPYGYHSFSPDCHQCPPEVIKVFDEAAEDMKAKVAEKMARRKKPRMDIDDNDVTMSDMSEQGESQNQLPYDEVRDIAEIAGLGDENAIEMATVMFEDGVQI